MRIWSEVWPVGSLVVAGALAVLFTAVAHGEESAAAPPCVTAEETRTFFADVWVVAGEALTIADRRQARAAADEIGVTPDRVARIEAAHFWSAVKAGDGPAMMVVTFVDNAGCVVSTGILRDAVGRRVIEAVKGMPL